MTDQVAERNLWREAFSLALKDSNKWKERAEEAEANISELLAFLGETAETLRLRDDPEVSRIIDNVLRKFGEDS